MNTIKNLIGICLLAIFLVSCSKDETPQSSGGDVLLLREMKVNGVLASRFDYNNDNKRSVYHLYDAANNAAPSGTILYTYNADGLLNTVTQKSANGQVQTTENYTYGNGPNPTSMLQTVVGGNSVSWQYTYPDQQVIANAVVPQTGETFIFNYNFDNNKNILSLISTGMLPTHLELGNYDNQKSMNKNGDPYHWLNAGENNARSEKHPMLNIDLVLEHTYNDAGYPIMTKIYDKQTNVLVEERTFTYIPAN